MIISIKYVSIKILILFVLFFTGSCSEKSSKSNKEEKIISNALQDAKIAQSNELVVILPGLGCDGCIQEGEAFMKDFVDSTKILFVLTKLQSLKILQNKVGKDLGKRTNVFIDKTGIFELPTDNSIYPCIVRLKNGKIIDHQFQCPTNSQAFEWLKTQME